jgi:DNA-binding CsgD family transcriptional regulator
VLAWSLLPIDEARASAIIDDALGRARAGVARTIPRLVFLQVMLLLRRRDHAGAQALLEEATAIAIEHGDRRMIVWFFIPGFARTHFMAGRADVAARLLAAADRALEEAGASMPLWMRADDGGGIDATRSALADSRFDAARAEGAAPTIEQALELARTANVDASPPDGEDLQELTSREREVLRLLTRELTDAQIAQQLVVSRRTVHAHLRSIYRKLDVSSRAAAARWAAEHSLRS